MANHVRIGCRRLNLDKVTMVLDYDIGCKVFFDHAEGNGDGTTETAWLKLTGDEAKLFLMVWDGEDGEEFDALYAKVNGSEAKVSHDDTPDLA